MRRCKPGIRARIIRGGDAGRIVVIVKRYFGELVNNAHWPRAMFPWVVLSLAGPLRSVYIETSKEAPPSMTVVYDDCDLEPLPDDKEDLDTGEEKKRNKPRETVLTSKV